MVYHELYKTQQLERVNLNLTHHNFCDRFYSGCLGKRYVTFLKMFEFLNKIKTPIIIETGISRMIDNYAGDGHSTLLFDEYLHFFKKSGHLYTVDIEQDLCDFTAPLLTNKSTVICSDSIVALHTISNSNIPPIDLLYLDSYDVDWDDPHPSALHHLKELVSIAPKLKTGTLIVVDDHDQGKGKGKYIAEYMNSLNKPPYFNEYQIGWIW